MKPTAIISSAASVVLTTGLILGCQALTRSKSLQDVTADANAAAVVVNINYSSGDLRDTGSGWFFDNHGDVATAYHVVFVDQENVQVVFADGSKHKGSVVCKDESKDFAIVHVEGVARHAHLDFDDSDTVRAGDKLVAVGNPLNVGQSDSYGYVSNPLVNPKGAVGSDKYGIIASSSVTDGDYVQTDAAINHGNSGGPAVRVSTGKVVGMADIILSNLQLAGGPGTNAGVNFLVPSRDMLKIIATCKGIVPHVRP